MDSHTLNISTQNLRNRQPDAHLWAVLPPDLPAQALEKNFPLLRAADGFALHEPSLAPLLRRLDWRGPILLLQGVTEPRALELCSRLGLWHVVHTDAHIDWLAAHKSQLPQHVWLPLASAEQPGFALARLRSAYARLSALPQVESITLALHDAQALDDFAAHTADLAGEHVLCHQHRGSAALEGGDLPPAVPLADTLSQAFMCQINDIAS